MINFYKPLTFFVCLLVFSTTVVSQNAVLDSLRNELSQYQEETTERVDLLNDIAYKNYGINQDSLKIYADKARDLARELLDHKGEGRSLYLISIYHLSKGGLDEASTSIQASLIAYEKAEDSIGMSTCYDLIGTISMFQEDYEKSILNYEKSLQIAKDEGDEKRIAGVLVNIAGVRARKGDFEEAVELYMSAIERYENLGETQKIIIPLNNIALTYSEQGRHSEALEYFQKGLKSNREVGNKISISSTLLNMGGVYISLDEHDKALPYFEEALELNRELENDIGIARNLNGLGVIAQSKNEYEKAMNYYNDALQIGEKIESKEEQYTASANIASLQLELKNYNLALSNYSKCLEFSLALGQKRAIAESYVGLGATYHNLKNYSKALDNTRKGKEIADQLSLLKVRKQANHLLFQLYEQKGNYKAAFKSLRDYKRQSDSLFNKESVQKITQLEAEYSFQQKIDSASIRELKLTQTVFDTSQNLEKSKRSFLWAIIGILVVSMLLGGIILYMKFRNIKSETQNIIIEQKLLRSQMTPHFIFNSLSVLQGMILNKEEKKSVLYLSKFSKLLRIILENSRDKMVSLSQELSAIENYLALQNLENESYTYTVSIEEKIDVTLFEIPPMLIQPFVENAIEHAFKNQKENRIIDVNLTYLDKRLICTIIDNGIGINFPKKNKRTDKNSLATTITSERLKILSKDFKMDGSVTVEDRQKDNEQGTIVTLVIPHTLNTYK